MFNILADVISKTDKIQFSDGALLSLVAILIVFAVLFMIIGITELIFKATGLFDLKKELDEYKNNGTVKKESKNEKVYHDTVEITDDDMMVAVLIASIDYQEEIKKDVRLVSVKEVK